MENHRTRSVHELNGIGELKVRMCFCIGRGRYMNCAVLESQRYGSVVVLEHEQIVDCRSVTLECVV